MRNVLLILTAVALLGVTTSARAGSALGLLRLDKNVTNLLDDEDFETFVDANGDAVDVTKIAGLYVPPDDSFLLAMWNVQTVKYPPTSDAKDPTTNAFTAISVVKVDYTDASGTHFVPLTAADWTTVSGFLPAAAIPVNKGQSMGILFDDGIIDNPPDRWINPDKDGSNPTGGFDATDWAEDFNTAVGKPLWEFGFTGAGGASANGEFWTAQIGLTSASYDAALDVTHEYAAVSGIQLLGHDAKLFNLVYYGGLTSYGWQFELSGGIDDTTVYGDGFYSTDTNIYLKPVPEPGSIALLALGLGAIGVVYRKRRSK
jgi:hypothetical protein